MNRHIFPFVLFFLVILFGVSETLSQTSSSAKKSKLEKQQQQKTNEKTVSITGNSKELVIIMGFPDRDTSYPVIKSNDKFPPLGAFPDGTLLSDYMASHGGSIAIDKWYKPALNHFYSSHSGGKYNVEFDFIKAPSGRMYLTKDSLSKWIGKGSNSGNDVIWNNWHQMVSQVAEKVYNDNKNAFSEVKAIHFVFSGMNKNEFNTQHGGTVEWDTEIKGSSGKTYYKGPVSIQREVNAIAHERMHIIGRLAGAPKGFNGFPDRGFDVISGEDHTNLLYGYDMMYHNAAIVSEHSLYGYPPIISHDLIFLGWIKPEEILTVTKKNFKSYIGKVKLADVNYPLSEKQLKQGYKRILKVMIKENYSDNLDEYFLVEFHNATEFDKNFSNYDEFPLFGYNKGILIWHIKEKTKLINTFADNIIDLLTAVPYNGYYGSPIPNDNYPRDYKRPKMWNGNFSGEYDYLDDGKMENRGGAWVFTYLPDGGRSNWEITTKGLDWTWYPQDKKRFPRLLSLRSDFFSELQVKGHIKDKLTDATHPSSCSWGGEYGSGRTEKSEKTHIAITSIRHEKDYMTANVYFNYWEGEVEDKAEMDGNVIIGNDLKVPLGATLTVKKAAKFKFLNKSKIFVEGNFVSEGKNIPKKNIVFRKSRTTEKSSF
ncbi:MAG: hypothetical protein Q8933_05425 [Bacteroidota bacterium]|nr:hypothetical protein [Bacteroidota bacterium]MDP4193710.1 hypothetical protein [Bacteroidota bacterium]